MGLLTAILTLLLIGLVVLVIGAPLRRARRAGGGGFGVQPLSQSGEDPASPPVYAREDLESAREAKYREIRDAELDYRTGKLSREDYRAIDAELRAEAIEILNRLERLRPKDA